MLDITSQTMKAFFLLILYQLLAHYFKNMFGLHLDKKLNFSYHINVKISKANRGRGIIKRLSHILPRTSLITI